jgi:hypothetical protein
VISKTISIYGLLARPWNKWKEDKGVPDWWTAYKLCTQHHGVTCLLTYKTEFPIRQRQKKGFLIKKSLPIPPTRVRKKVRETRVLRLKGKLPEVPM